MSKMDDKGFGWEIPKERLEKDMQIIHINKDNINQGIDGAKFSEEIKVIFHEKGMPVTIKKMKTKGFGWDMSGAKWQMGIDGLEGKNLSKKGAFEYESDVNIEEFYCKKEEFVYNKQGFAEKKDKKEKEEKEIKCEACQKSFTCEASLKRHL